MIISLLTRLCLLLLGLCQFLLIGGRAVVRDGADTNGGRLEGGQGGSCVTARYAPIDAADSLGNCMYMYIYM